MEDSASDLRERSVPPTWRAPAIVSAFIVKALAKYNMIDAFVNLIHGDSGWVKFWETLGEALLQYFEDYWYVFDNCKYLEYGWDFIKHLFHIIKDYRNRWLDLEKNLLCTYTYYRDGDEYSSGQCYGTFWKELIRLD